MSFQWNVPFLHLIAFNILIFMLSWALPMCLFARRMREFRIGWVDPEIPRLEQ